MKNIEFKSYKQFCKAEVKKDGKTNLFYSRLFGNQDWGFVITGVRDAQLELNQPAQDYIQAQFLTHDVMLITGTATLIGNKERKVLTLRGISEENYQTACKWIEEQREVLLESVCDLTGEYNPLQDALVTELLESQEVTDDTH